MKDKNAELSLIQAIDFLTDCLNSKNKPVYIFIGEENAAEIIIAQGTIIEIASHVTCISLTVSWVDKENDIRHSCFHKSDIGKRLFFSEESAKQARIDYYYSLIEKAQNESL